MPPMATYEEVDQLGAPELRFRQACQFYTLFKDNHGAEVDPLDTRFLWICHADAFLILLVSLKDLVTADQRKALQYSDLFRRNPNTHKSVANPGNPGKP